MTVRDIIVKITQDLPGSIGTAQVGQVVKRTLDILASMSVTESDVILERRRKAMAKSVAKEKAKPGSANCILPRKK